MLAGARAFHTTGITAVLSDGCARAAADALAAARAAGCRTSYDVNLRRRLAPPEAGARGCWSASRPALDLVLCSAEDAARGLRRRGGRRDRSACGSGSESSRCSCSPARSRSGRTARTASVDGGGTVTSTLARSAPVDPIGAGDAFARGLPPAGSLAGRPRPRARLGGAMATLKQTVPGDAPVVDLEELEAGPAETRRGCAGERGRRLVRVDGQDGRGSARSRRTRPRRIAPRRPAPTRSHLLERRRAREARRRVRRGDRAASTPETLAPAGALAALLLPLEPREVWCAGVTYERSRDARLEESRPRPATSTPRLRRRAAGALPQGRRRPPHRRARRPIGVRCDSTWSVPEPELGLVLGEGGALLGLDGRQRRLLARHRGREPALPPAGEGLRGRVRARARRCSSPTTGRSRSRSSFASASRGGRDDLRGRDVDGAHEARLRRAGRLLRPRQPRAARKRASDRHRARAGGRLHARARAWWSRSGSPESADW